jgi:hypothetical protein
MFVSFFYFYKGRYEFNQKHEKNINWAKIFIITYIFLWILTFAVTILIPILLFPEISLVLSVTFGITKLISFLMSFFLGFTILYLTKEIAGAQEKDLIYIFIIMILLFPIGLFIIELTFYPYQTYFGYIIYVSFTSIVGLITWSLALLAYSRIKKSFDAYSRYYPNETTRFLPRPEPLASYGYRFFSNPVKAFIVIFIIALLIGTGTGALVKSQYDAYYRALPESSDYLYHDLEHEQYASGSINEGETMDFTFEFDLPVYNFSVQLVWRDEPDQILRTNEPDRFSMSVSLGGLSDSKEDSNEQGDVGIIDVEWGIPKDDAMTVESVYIDLTLTQAGDQVGPMALLNSPLTVEDNSNDFELFVTYWCFYDGWVEDGEPIGT